MTYVALARGPSRTQTAQALAGAKPGESAISEEAIKAAGASVAYEGRITFFNGQIVHLAAGDVQSLIPQIEPVVSEMTAGIRPITKSVLWGALLETSAVLVGQKDQAELKVRSVVAEPRELRKKEISFAASDMVVEEKSEGGRVIKPSPGRGRTNTAEMDQPDFTLQTFTTNLNVPLGKPVLVGGTTMPTKAGKPQAMYLVVQLDAAK